MDDKRRAVISELAVAAHRARRNLQVMMQLNMPIDPEQAEKQAVASAIALAETEDAERALSNAIADITRVHA